MQEVLLKRCDYNNLPELMQVAQQSYKESYLYLWTDDTYAQWYINKNYSAESLTRQIAGPDTVFFLIVCDNKIVGYVKLNLNKAMDEHTTNKSLELERMYLLKEASGKGVGTAAMREIITYAKNNNQEIIWLKSMDSSPAVNFYEKIGFKKCGVERLPLEGFKDEYRNMFIMFLDINKF